VSATASDPDGGVARVEFYDGATLLGADTTVPFSLVWTSAAAGTHVLTAKAIDNLGASSQSNAVNIVVGQPPLVVMTVPSSCSVVDAPNSLALEADAVSPLASIALVEFFDGGALVGSASKFPIDTRFKTVNWHALDHRARDRQPRLCRNLAPCHRHRSVGRPTARRDDNFAERRNGISCRGQRANLSNCERLGRDGCFRRVLAQQRQQHIVLRTLYSPPFSFVATGLAASNYALTAIAADDRGAQTTSAAVHFSVAANAPPTVSLTAPAGFDLRRAGRNWFGGERIRFGRFDRESRILRWRDAGCLGLCAALCCHVVKRDRRELFVVCESNR
jgi:hypothetical protein